MNKPYKPFNFLIFYSILFTLGRFYVIYANVPSWHLFCSNLTCSMSSIIIFGLDKVRTYLHRNVASDHMNQASLNQECRFVA